MNRTPEWQRTGGRKGWADRLRKLKRGESVVLEGAKLRNASQAAAYALGSGAYVCRRADGGYRVSRIHD